MRGLDLFSGIGGITLALAEWVRPIAYCECDRYAQSVLLSRMSEGRLPVAPIWDDVRTLSGNDFQGVVDIIFGGFPCQDISSAGRGTGLEGERSGLFFEIMRLADEIKPEFIFLENVSAIRTRGLDRVGKELAARGYDCRWGMLSAFDVGAPHKRERWFCLARNTDRDGKPRFRVNAEMAELSGNDPDAGRSRRKASRDNQYRLRSTEARETNHLGSTRSIVADSKSIGLDARRTEQPGEQGRLEPSGGRSSLADSDGAGLQGRCECGQCSSEWTSWTCGGTFPGAWKSDAGILRVAHGIPQRVDRIKCLGNGVVPIQVREAFRRLMFG
jgi:DNA (cytosine-5)-methyltransferase 1